MGKARKPIQIVILFLIVLLGGYAISSSVFGETASLKKAGKRQILNCLGWTVRPIRWRNSEGSRLY